MARQGNIVDFNEARAATSARRAQSYADEWARSLDGAGRKRSSDHSRSSFSSLLDAPQSYPTEHRAHRSFSSTRGRADSGPSPVTARTNSLVERYAYAQSDHRFTGSYDRESTVSTSGDPGFSTYGSATPTMSARDQRTMPAWLSDAYTDLAAVRSNNFGTATASTSRSTSARAIDASTGYIHRERTGGGRTTRQMGDFDRDYGSPSRDFGARGNMRSGGGFSSGRFSDDASDGFGRNARADVYAEPASRSPRAAVFDEQSLREDEDGSAKPQEKGLIGRLKSLKHDAKKSRADRQFDRQFGDSDMASAESAGPRAALYKGEMGQQQRYASRLQRDNSPDEGYTGGPNYAPNRPTEHAPRAKRMKHPVLKISAAAVAIIICGALFMFPTVQSYYQTMREHDKLEAEYQAVEDRNTALQETISDLSSDDGVAAYAHDQYGWVKSNEQTAVVQGLELSDQDALSKVNASVQVNAIKAPETWYSPVLDKVFGFEN